MIGAPISRLTRRWIPRDVSRAAGATIVVFSIAFAWSGCLERVEPQPTTATAKTAKTAQALTVTPTSTWNTPGSAASDPPVPGHYVGACSAGGACAGPWDCPGGQSCSGGVCSGGSSCYADAQCGSAQTCGNGTCSISGTTCRLDAQCGTGQTCRRFLDLSVKGADNVWYVDYGANGYDGAGPSLVTRWDYAYSGYGDSTAVPAPADYDGDGFTDFAVKDSGGTWYIDYAANGLGSWDEAHSGYGDASAIPVPADYDGDGKADLAVKDATGFWGIDYARAPGFGSWDVERWGYGDATCIPVPADYDGDKLADLSIKNNTTGTWDIDYSRNGFGGRYNLRTHTRYLWDVQLPYYGVATPVPADYDNDGRADLSEKDSSGTWYIDYAADGFGQWNAIYGGYGGSSIAVPGDYDHDGLLDLSVVDPATGYWYVDYAGDGFGSWDLWPNHQMVIDDVGRQLVDTTKPYVASTQVLDPKGNPASALMVGVGYTLDVAVQPGTSGAYSADVEMNPTLFTPPSLQAHDGNTWHNVEAVACTPGSSTACMVDTDNANKSGDCNASTDTCNTHWRFRIACSQPGPYLLGLQLRNDVVWKPDSTAFNPDYGMKVYCTAAQNGLYGTVTNRTINGYGVYTSGAGVPNATVTIDGTGISTMTDQNGNWSLPISGGPFTVRVSGQYCPGPSCRTSDTVAVNVVVPPSGFELDTPLEDPFAALRAVGSSYTTYIDYSRNRNVLHVVQINSSAAAAVRLAQSPFTISACDKPHAPRPQDPFLRYCTDPSSTSQGYPNCPYFAPLSQVAATQNALVLINAVWWDQCTGQSQGYMYSQSIMPSEVYCYAGTPQPPATSTSNCTGSQNFITESGDLVIPQDTTTLLGITGTASQSFQIYESDENFLEQTSGTAIPPPSASWTLIDPTLSVWDPAHSGVSNITYGLQIGNPPLLWTDAGSAPRVIAGGDFKWSANLPDYDFVWARTAVGVDATRGVLYLVVADGEGINGGNGATAHQLGVFFRDVLHATAAFALDSGLSTSMFLQPAGPNPPRRVNTVTGEDARIQNDPYTQPLPLGWTAVANYLALGRTSAP
jgi:hypothetical protein